MESTALRALLVSDDDAGSEGLAFELERAGMSVTFDRVETPHAMVAALAASPFDVVLSEFTLPLFDVLEALALLQARGLEIPVIVVSDTQCEKAVVGALRAGACDFIPRCKLGRLAPAIARELRTSRLRSRVRATEQQLRDAPNGEAMRKRHRGIAHDLNNALSAVLLHVDLLRDELRASGAGTQDLDAIADAGLRATEITFQLAIRP